MISAYLEKLVSVHGTRHPELSRVESAFRQMSRDLAPHLMKEEHVLFPYIAELLEWAGARDDRPDRVRSAAWGTPSA